MSMKHLKEYEESQINEGLALGTMPAFLKSAGAKAAVGPHSPGAWLASGQPKLSNDCWELKLNSPLNRGEKVSLYFYPEKRFSFNAGPGIGSKFSGTWEIGTSSDRFTFGTKSLTGVKMNFTEFGGIQTID